MATMEQGLIISHEQLAADLFEIELMAPNVACTCEPGQFLQVRINAQNDPLLRRPISIYDVDKQRGTITLLYKLVGKGTRILTDLKPQRALDIMGPLGKGFSLPIVHRRVVLVGGGVGIAPLLYLARRLRDLNCEVKALYGVANRSELVAADKFTQLQVELMAATMDGSAGYKGLVTDLLYSQIEVQQTDLIYTCGPEIMMAAVAKFAARNNKWGECSLEENMACGVGACLGCARKLRDEDAGYVKVCKDGPVFNMQSVQLYNGGL